jgi:hypothetical protein
MWNWSACGLPGQATADVELVCMRFTNKKKKEAFVAKSKKVHSKREISFFEIHIEMNG